MMVSDMFFRTRKLKETTFNERTDALKKLGLTVEVQGPARVRVRRGECAADVEDVTNAQPRVLRAGILIGAEIGVLVNGGYQMFLETPSGKRVPAQAEQLHALHEFQEDLWEGLGLSSLYNQSLGTVSARHMYDRVEERDSDHPKKAWEVKV